MTNKKPTFLALICALMLTASPVWAADMSTSTSGPAPAGAPSAEGEHKGPPMGGPEGGDKESPEKHFLKADTDHDGFLSKAEMEAEHQKRLDEMFAESDTNHDGKLSPEELKAGREKMRQKFEERRQERGEGKGGERPDGPPPEQKQDAPQ